MSFNYGTPGPYVEQNVNAEFTLDTQYTYAVVQFKDNAGNYTSAPGKIAFYKRNGESPDPATQNGFYAGDGDTIVFNNRELVKGVKIINFTGGAMDLAIQYYRNAP